MKKSFNNVWPVVTPAALLLFPLMASAQQFLQTIGLINGLTTVVGKLIYVLAGVAVLVFFWGLVKYIASAGNEEAAKKGKSIMVYGVIALFVMFSFWGIITFIGGDLLIPQQQPTGL